MPCATSSAASALRTASCVWSAIFPGIFTAFLLGIVIVCNATAFISLVHILIGIFTLVTGTLQVQSSVDAKRFGMPRWWLLLIGAILTMALGVLLVIAPFEGPLAIVCLLGATLIVEGIENLFILLYMVKYRNN